MKRIISLVLACVWLLTACSTTTNNAAADNSTLDPATEGVEQTASGQQDIETSPAPLSEGEDLIEQAPPYHSGPDIAVKGLDDPTLLSYVEDNVYSELVTQLNSEDYFIENVEAEYYPKEYIEALVSNSQANLYFGYTSAELNAQFSGTKYVFTLGADGLTKVVPMETVNDDIYVKAMEDVIVGSGVILVCVTVSLVAAPAAPAVGMIFAASASTGTTFALHSGAISFAAAAIAKGYETESFDQAIKAGVEAAGEGFKWGAITGAVVGGVSQGASLYGAAKQTNFTMNEYARIQKETGYPLDVIKEFHTMEEYQAFRDANLRATMVGNKSALVRTDIDLWRLDSKGRTNLERMKQGLSPLDANGKSYQLHHVGQRKNGTLAILTEAEHDNPALHGFLERTEAHGPGNNWDAERQAFWKAYAALFG